jgi:hypothetical protein
MCATTSTVRFMHCPVLRPRPLRTEKYIWEKFLHFSTHMLCYTWCWSCGSPNSHLPSEPRLSKQISRLLGWELIFSLEWLVTHAKWEDKGAEGVGVEVSIVGPQVILKSLICVCQISGFCRVRYTNHTWEVTAILLPQLTALFVYKFFPFLFYDAVVVCLMEV